MKERREDKSDEESAATAATVEAEPPETGAEETALVESVFGESPPEPSSLIVRPVLKTEFAPWHHPVKQLVREYQWADLTKKLMEEERSADRRHILKYFTLPGSDLLDVRVLADALQPIGSRIEYFGFDAGYRGVTIGGPPVEDQGVYLATESSLRQAGRITDNAEILNDRLEDIAQAGTQAANRLQQQAVFDVINIDACDHLGFVPRGRTKSVFDALECLLAHQLKAQESWLLFVTTRANPTQLGAPAIKLQDAIHGNLKLYWEEFGQPLADCIEGQLQTLATDLATCWSEEGVRFLRLFCIGLGKYLLQFFHGQHNLPADVELASAYAYTVHGPEPDMLSLAFRIKPRGVRVQPATAGTTSIVPPLEAKRAISVVHRAKRLWNLDAAIAADAQVRQDAVQGAANLLRSADYDLSSWQKWLANLTLRPMNIDDLMS